MRPVPSHELMLDVKDASYAHELPLLLHANSPEAHRFAARVGVDAVVHGLRNWGVMIGGAGLAAHVASAVV